MSLPRRIREHSSYKLKDEQCQVNLSPNLEIVSVEIGLNLDLYYVQGKLC